MGATATTVEYDETSPTSTMPFKSKAQRRKFAQLLVEGKITPEVFEEWNRETGGEKLPERVEQKKKKKKKTKTTRKRKTSRPKRATSGRSTTTRRRATKKATTRKRSRQKSR